MATTRQSISCMIKNYSKNGKEFFWSNYKLSKKLNKSEKTIANTISLMRRQGELETLNHGKTRYLKLSDPKIKKIIPDVVKRFYADSGRNEGSEKGVKSGTPIYNINISKAKASFNKHIITESLDMLLVADIKKVVTNFKNIESFVCSVDNDKLLRKTLEEYHKNINPFIKNPAGLFRKNVADNLERFNEEKVAILLEKERKKQQEYLNALKGAVQRKAKIAALEDEKILNQWFDDYGLKFTETERQNHFKEFIFTSDNFSYLEIKNKKEMINNYKTPEKLGYGNRLHFKDFMLGHREGEMK